MATKNTEKYDINMEVFFDEEGKQLGAKGDYRGDKIKISSGFETAKNIVGFFKGLWTASKDESKTK